MALVRARLFEPLSPLNEAEGSEPKLSAPPLSVTTFRSSADEWAKVKEKKHLLEK